VSRLAKNVSCFGFVTVKNSKNHEKRVTFGQNVTQSTFFQKISCPEIVSHFGQRVTIWQCREDMKFNLEKFLSVKNRVTISAM